MTAIKRLTAWLRSTDRDQADRPGTDQQFREWLDTPGDLAGCSCSARRVVVIHDRGSYCGDLQQEQLWHAVDGSGAIDATDAVEAVLDVLRGGGH